MTQQPEPPVLLGLSIEASGEVTRPDDDTTEEGDTQ